MAVNQPPPVVIPVSDGTPPAPSEAIAIELRDVHFAYPIRGVRMPRLVRKFAGRVGGQLTQKGHRTRVDAVRGVNLSIPVGGRIGIVGSNGAGKSTILRLIAGIFAPSSGEVVVRGRVAAIFDTNVGTDPELSGFDNIRLRGMFLGRTAEEIDARVEDIAAFSELGDYLSLPVRVYSPGMRARLGFSICTAFEPDILLLDEWLGVADRAFTNRARERMEQFFARAGTVVLASHNRELIERNCDEVIVMQRGQIRVRRPVRRRVQETKRAERKAAAAQDSSGESTPSSGDPE